MSRYSNLFSLAVFLIPILSFGQTWRARISAGSTLSKSVTNTYFENQLINPAIGYFIQGGLEYTFTRKFALIANLTFSRDKYTVENANYNAIRANTTNQFVQLPVDLKFDIGQLWGIHCYVLAGPSIRYWHSSRIQSTLPNIFNIDFDKDNSLEIITLAPTYQRIDLDDGYRELAYGYQVGTGFNKSISDRMAICLEARFNQELTNRLQHDIYFRRYRNVSIGFVLHYQIHE